MFKDDRGNGLNASTNYCTGNYFKWLVGMDSFTINTQYACTLCNRKFDGALERTVHLTNEIGGYSL